MSVKSQILSRSLFGYSSKLLLTLLLLGLLLAASFQTASAATQELGGDFTLTDHHGKPFTLSEQRGKVVVMFFGFTHCPAICPDSLAKMALALKQLGDQAADVQPVFITVDPARDTQEILAAYVPYFSKDILALRGSKQALEKVVRLYRVKYQLNRKSVDDKHYTVDHTPDFYVIAADGSLDSIIPYGMPAQHIQTVLRGVLDKSARLASEAIKQRGSDETRPTSADIRNKSLANSKSSDRVGISSTEVETTAPTLIDLEGNPAPIEAHLGKPVLVNFWASWCPPCRAELPALNRAWKTLRKDGIVMLAVNIGEAETAVRAFLKDYPIDFPVRLDTQSASFANWDIVGMPTTIILNAQGELVERITGVREWDSPEVLDKIREAIDATPLQDIGFRYKAR